MLDGGRVNLNANYEKGIKIFENGLKELGIELCDKQISQFIQYYEYLVEKNKVMNLTAITEFEEVIVKHFLDSLSLVKAIDLSKCSSEVKIIDIGTGAGFPGIPIKIAFPQVNIILLDSLNKRINFLNEVIDILELEGIIAVHGRSEEFGIKPEYREQFDLCVSRAVANLSVLSEFCIPFVKVGGQFISYKAGDSNEEIKDGEFAVNLLGGKIKEEILFTIPNSDISRKFVVIDKNKNTGKKYPRKAGTPAKNPIKISQ